MSPLWNWFRDNALPFFKGLFESAIEFLMFNTRFIFSAGKFIWLVACGVIVASYWAVVTISDMMENLDINALAHPTAQMLQYYAFMNRFLPLAEGFAGAVICFDVWLVIVLIRWIKSFIPTLSN